MRKEFPILVARVSEIAILCMRFAIKIIYRRTLYFIPCWKEFSFSRKEFPILGARVSEIEILLKIFRCNAFLPQEFSLLFNLVSRTSILLERITIKMIILIRIFVLKRRICYLGNLECATWESANIDFICFANKGVNHRHRKSRSGIPRDFPWFVFQLVQAAANHFLRKNLRNLRSGTVVANVACRYCPSEKRRSQ